MNSLSAELVRVVQVSLGQHGSTALAVVLGVLALLAAALVVNFVGEIFGCKLVNSSRASLVVLATAVVLLGAAALIGVYMCSRISSAAAARWLPLTAAVVAFLAVVLPLARLILKAGYFQALFTMGLSLAAAAALVAVVNAAIGMTKAGESSVGDSIGRLLDRERLKEGIR
ncbi:MAG: hypothetical protein QME60_08440 [Verrucomicrobiota bacterium]|nr:hypothetical protein [Verrucomicrobiota bacterium]